MGALEDFLECAEEKTPVLSHSTSKHAKSNYIALAMVLSGTLPEFGENFTPPGGGAPAALTAANLVSSLKALAFVSKCWFFGNETINGKKGKPGELAESATYGSRTVARPTGEVTEMVEFTFDRFYGNVEFFNQLRFNKKKYDLYMFTDRTVVCVRAKECKPTFHSIGHEVTGNYAEQIAGSFSVSYRGKKGELVPVFGISEAELDAEDLRYTFAAPGVPSGISLVVGTTDRYTMVTGTGGNFTRAVVEGGAPIYQLFKDCNKPVPVAELITIDSNTGKITVANGMPNGNYSYTVRAVNSIGVSGVYTFTLRVGAA
ncbi:Ig domain-containing protein [Tellurirhabdus bombi]|uniref:Ig domain-containing protein n=1 Tax=Tellurirhabdus bombi TaxID=2907205 RepID=UPI001F1589A5|nr:Ig domain-containing protein [Tellurirhabdus bombi]